MFSEVGVYIEEIKKAGFRCSIQKLFMNNWKIPSLLTPYGIPGSSDKIEIDTRQWLFFWW
jgi:hypothetical protein